MAERCRKRVNLKLLCDGKECICVSGQPRRAVELYYLFNYVILFSFQSVGNKCNCTIGSRSIGHLVGSMSLNILTELLVY